MPRGDGTGPMGGGSMTGRGEGFCSGVSTPGYTSSYGCGHGNRRMFYHTGVPGRKCFFNHAYTEAGIPDRKELLSRQAEALERQLIDVKKRLTDIEESDK